MGNNYGRVINPKDKIDTVRIRPKMHSKYYQLVIKTASLKKINHGLSTLFNVDGALDSELRYRLDGTLATTKN